MVQYLTFATINQKRVQEVFSLVEQKENKTRLPQGEHNEI
jgi:hypothetical protein